MRRYTIKMSTIITPKMKEDLEQRARENGWGDNVSAMVRYFIVKGLQNNYRYIDPEYYESPKLIQMKPVPPKTEPEIKKEERVDQQEKPDLNTVPQQKNQNGDSLPTSFNLPPFDGRDNEMQI